MRGAESRLVITSASATVPDHSAACTNPRAPRPVRGAPGRRARMARTARAAPPGRRLGVEAQAHVGGGRLRGGAAVPGAVAHRFERVPRQLHAGLSGLAASNAIARPRLPRVRPTAAWLASPSASRAPTVTTRVGVGRVSAVHECCERSSPAKRRMGELEKRTPLTVGRIAVRKNGERDGRLGVLAPPAVSSLLRPTRRRPGRARRRHRARRATVSHRGYLQLREGERLVPHPRHDSAPRTTGTGEPSP